MPPGGGGLGRSSLADAPDGLPFLPAGLRQRNAGIAVAHPLGVCLGLGLAGAADDGLVSHPYLGMVCDVARAPVVVQLMQARIVAAEWPAWPSDVDGLCRVLENPVDCLGLPCRLRPFRQLIAEWVVLVDSIEDVFEDAGEYPAVDVLLGQAFRLIVDGSCHSLVLLVFDDVSLLCQSHFDGRILRVVECQSQGLL